MTPPTPQPGFHTRSVLRPGHRLLAAEDVPAEPLPGAPGAQALVYTTPALSGLLAYRLHLPQRGKLSPAPSERFVLLLEGQAAVIGPGLDRTLAAGEFVLMPAGQPTTLLANTALAAIVIEKRFVPLPGAAAPSALVGRLENTTDPAATALHRQALLPPNPALDLAVSLLTAGANDATPERLAALATPRSLLLLEGSATVALADETCTLAAGDSLHISAFWPAMLTAGPGMRLLLFSESNRTLLL